MRILAAGACCRNVSVQRSACMGRTEFCPLNGFFRRTFHQCCSGRRQSYVASLKSHRLPTDGAIHCGQSPIKPRYLGPVPFNVPILDEAMAIRAYFIWGHCQAHLGRSITCDNYT
jgi:hypothetical protein